MNVVRTCPRSVSILCALCHGGMLGAHARSFVRRSIVFHPIYSSRNTVNQQILAAIKFGVSQNKVIWRLLNLASPRLCSVRST